MFLDFTVDDSEYGLKGTGIAEKAGLYLLPPVGKSRKSPLDQFTQFVIADSDCMEHANFMVGVSDGHFPDVWIGKDSPYDKHSNLNNFVWALEQWNPK